MELKCTYVPICFVTYFAIRILKTAVSSFLRSSRRRKFHGFIAQYFYVFFYLSLKVRGLPAALIKAQNMGPKALTSECPFLSQIALTATVNALPTSGSNVYTLG